MNILPKKSWHVRNKDNIARVRRDEENARLEEEKLAKRAALAEQEARTNLLRKKVKNSKRHVSSSPLSSEKQTQNSIVKSDESETRHINLFFEAESGSTGSSATNKEYEAERKAEQEKKEKALGVLKYLGQSTFEDAQPWYIQSGQDKANESKAQSGKDAERKAKIDPMLEMKSFLEQTKTTDKLKRKGKEPRKEMKTKKRKKTMEDLRAERLHREKEERFKADKLIKESKGQSSFKAADEMSINDSRYYSQYNPDLARKPKWNHRY